MSAARGETRLNDRKAQRHSYSVYVIELDPAVLSRRRFAQANPGRDPDKPCVYVGMTGLPVGERFQNHKAGVRCNAYVRDFGLRLLPELFACYNPMPYAAAQEMERELADALREEGYAVWQN